MALWGYGQEIALSEPLETVLEKLERSEGIRFNYDPALLEGVTLPPPSPGMGREALLEYLSGQTGLEFRPVGDNIIAIVRNRIRVCAYLKDKDTSEPISGATILAQDKAVISDPQGYFEITVTGADPMLEIRHMGYRTLKRAAGFFQSGSCGTVYLIGEILQIPEVVVSGFLIRGIDKMDDGAFQMNLDEFSLLPGLVDKDVLQAVQALPGILSANEKVSDINIRGGTHDQNLILWDGIKMYQSGHFFGLISLYNPQITQKVTLRKNGTPAAFSDGVSGTISMETQQGVTRDFFGSVGVNFIDASLFADVPISDQSSVQLAGRKAINPWVETPTYTAYYDRISQDTELTSQDAQGDASDIGFDFYDLSLRWLYTPTDKDRIRLNFITAFNEVSFDETAAGLQGASPRESQLSQSTIAGGLHYYRKWSPRWATEFDAYNTDYALEGTNSNVLQDQRFLQENKVSETGVRLQVRHGRGPLEYALGYQYQETKVSDLDDVDNPVYIRRQSRVLRSQALFGQLGWASAGGRTHLNLGFRGTYLQKFNRLIWEPRLSFNQELAPGLTLEILSELKHQTTSQIVIYQDDFLGLEQRRWQLTDNDEIPLIQGFQSSAGLTYSRKGWLLHAEAFYKEVTGITSQSQGFLDAYRFVQADGSYDAYGAEFMVKKRYGRWDAWASYSYLESSYSFPGLPEESFPNNLDITHTVGSGITYAAPQFLVSGGLTWHSGRPFTLALPGNTASQGPILYDIANGARLPDYLRLDVSALYRVSLGTRARMELGASLLNVLNRQNPVNQYYRRNATNQVEAVLQNALGLTPNALLRLTF